MRKQLANYLKFNYKRKLLVWGFPHPNETLSNPTDKVKPKIKVRRKTADRAAEKQEKQTADVGNVCFGINF